MKDEISLAFNLLMESVQKEISSCREQIKEEVEKPLIKNKRKDKIALLTQRVKKLESLSKKIIDLKESYRKRIYSSNNKVMRIGKDKKNKKEIKLPRGLKTPQEEYEIPILKSIFELGGRGKAKEILNLVYEKMEHKLNDYDLERLPKSNVVRWYRTAQWAGWKLMQKRFIIKGYSRGIWIITKNREEYLKNKNIEG